MFMSQSISVFDFMNTIVTGGSYLSMQQIGQQIWYHGIIGMCTVSSYNKLAFNDILLTSSLVVPNWLLHTQMQFTHMPNSITAKNCSLHKLQSVIILANKTFSGLTHYYYTTLCSLCLPWNQQCALSICPKTNATTWAQPVKCECWFIT